MPSSYGQRFVETVRDHLKKNGLKSLGGIDGPALAALADKFEQAERLKDKRDREKRLGKGDLEKLYEALALGCGCNLEAMTEDEQKRCAIARSKIVRASPQVTPEDVAYACKRYRLEMPRVTITPFAVSNNWSKLYVPPGKPPPPLDPIPEPERWRERIKKNCGENSIWMTIVEEGRQWDELGRDWQTRITALCNNLPF